MLADGTVLEPFDDRVVVRQDNPERMSPEGKIIIPETADRPRTGTIVAVGPGRSRADGSRIPMNVKTGDRVMFGRYSGHALDPGYRRDRAPHVFVVMREDELLGRLMPAGKNGGAARV